MKWSINMAVVAIITSSFALGSSALAYYSCNATVVKDICVSGYPYTLRVCKKEDAAYKVGARVEIIDTHVENDVRMFSFYRGMDASADHYRLDKGCKIQKLRQSD